jgi:AraC-like DNA-binding protein
MALPSVLESFGVDAARLLREFGLGLPAFRNPETRIPYSTLDRIVGRCVEATSCEHFGLLIGEQAGITSMGAVGYLAQSAPDVRTALHALQRMHHLHDGGGVITFEHRGGSVSFGYEIVEPGVQNADQLIAASIAIGFNILRSLCGPGWQPTDVHFSLASPPATARIRRLFFVTPRFDQERSRITFPARWLARSPPGADPLLHQIMRERVDDLLAKDGGDVNFTAVVRSELRRMLADHEYSIDAIADQLGIPVRTLKRRLATAGTTVLDIRDEVRHDKACQLLRRTGMPINEIASSLGYRETSSFTRAFGRWAGVGPAEWRKRQAKPDARAAPTRRA